VLSIKNRDYFMVLNALITKSFNRINHSPDFHHSSLVDAAAWLVIGAGIFLRLRQYTLNLSFWLDEAMLALNITNRNFAGLAHPLDYDQGAPLGFLWLVKAIQTVLGNHEYSLRLLPFLAGCLALPVFWVLARQLVKPVGALFALLLLAVSGYVISYAAQVKQYELDMTIALLLYLFSMRLLRAAPCAKCPVGGKDVWLLAGLGALAIWCSHPAVFVLAGIGSVLIAQAWLKKDRRQALLYGLAAGFWMLNFAALYLIQYRGLASNSYLTGFWADYFMPLSAAAPAWAFDSLAGLFVIPGGLQGGWPSFAMLALFLIGLVSLFWRDTRSGPVCTLWVGGWVWMFAISLALTLAASSLQKYPFGGRMGLFALPGLLICAGEGLETLRVAATRTAPRESAAFTAKLHLGTAAALLLAGVLAYGPSTLAVDQAIAPKMTENIAPTMAYLQANYRPGDGIYLYRMAIPAFRYYAPKYKFTDAPVVNGTDLHLDRQNYAAEVKKLAGNQRAWLLFSHMTDPEYVQDREAILAAANGMGVKRREFSQPGTLVNLYLYDLGP